MIFYLIGLEYKDIPPDEREIIHRRRSDIIKYWSSVNPKRSSVLVTCNRIEIYGAADTPREAEYFYRTFKHIFGDIIGRAFVLYGLRDISRHALRLACGVESRLRGEYQIFRQIDSWMKQRGFPEELFGLWADILSSARRIRDDAGLGADVISIGNIVFDDLARRVNTGKKARVLIIGTGKVAELIARLKPAWAKLGFMAGKKFYKAGRLAELSGGEALVRDDLSESLTAADTVICATSSPHYALRKEDFKFASGTRTEPLYIYDLALPRDVAPDVREVRFNRIINIDEIIDNFNRGDVVLRKLDRAIRLIEEELKKYGRGYEDPGRRAAEQACYHTG